MNGISRQGRICDISLFNKKETVVLKSEQQKDAYIDRLEKNHVEYDAFEDRETIYSRDVSYIIRIKVSDLKKVSKNESGETQYLRFRVKPDVEVFAS